MVKRGKMSIGVKIKFWGVRGSIPTPGTHNIKYGGNTPCVELQFSDDLLFILDGGTGIRELGKALSENGRKVKTNILLTHFHWDHIQGLPFFLPFYNEKNKITMLGMDLQSAKLENAMSEQMESIYFPKKLHTLSAHVIFRKLCQGTNDVEGINVETMYLNHPGQSMGYVFNVRKKKICYFTDNELVPKWVNKTDVTDYNLNIREKMLNLISGADLLIHDAQYTNEQYKTKIGWGHSPLSEVIKLAQYAKVKTLVLFHHDPDHNDDDIDFLVANSKEMIKNSYHAMECLAAHEGLEIHF